MAKDLSEAATDDLEEDDVFEEDDSPSSVFENGAAMGGRDSSIRRRIEERLERKRLLDELGLLDEELDL